MLTNYGYIGLFLVIAILFPISTIIIPSLLRMLKVVPRKSTPTKSSTFECGMETIGKTWVQFNFRYYCYAIIFLVLDVLVVFLYPWAVTLRQLGYSGLISIVIVIAIVIVGYIYAWKKKVLEWK